MNCSHFSVKDWTSWLGVVGVIRTAMSRSLPAIARPRAHEFTTRIVSTYACDAKKSPTRPATSRWSSVGNLSAEIIDCSVRRTSAFTRTNEKEISHGRVSSQEYYTRFAFGALAE